MCASLIYKASEVFKLCGNIAVNMFLCKILKIFIYCTSLLDRMVHGSEKHGIPLLISFFIPGLGQIVKGQIAKGILIIIGMVVSSLLIFVLIGFITTPLLWLWNIYDAYNSN